MWQRLREILLGKLPATDQLDVVAINGPSYRLKNRPTAIDGQANVA
ncbi:hypothetical protein AB0B48_10440 [Micromonospora sp. NPDC049089]